jgi:hypothetical protein
MPTTQQVLAKLSSIGTPVPGGQFHQSEHHQHVPDQVPIVMDGAIVSGVRLADKTGEGYCRGACTDWARKILQGGKAVYNGNNVKSVAMRHAAIQVRIDMETDKRNEDLKLFEDINQLYQPALKRYQSADVYQKPNLNTITLPQPIVGRLRKRMPEYELPDGAKFYLKDIPELLKAIDSKTETFPYRTSAGWQAFVSDMDQLHKAFRTVQGGEASSRPFANMRILGCSGRIDYGSVPAALNNLFRLNAFVAGTVMILGFQTNKTTDTGHAVAVNARSAGHVFFDPNFGVYLFKQLDVVKALRYLFEGDDPAYTGTGAVSYLLIGRA